MGSMEKFYHSKRSPTVLSATIDGINIVVLPTNLKFLCKPRKTLPSFSGSENGALVEDWFQECEKVADLFGWNDVTMLKQFSGRLKGDAFIFHRKNVAHIKDYRTWRTYMTEEFIQKDKHYFLEKLDYLRQKSNQSVEAFADEIDSVLVKALGLGVFTNSTLHMFCKNVKLAYLIDGVRSVVRKEIDDHLYNYLVGLSSWSRVVEEVQDIEWLVDLKKKQCARNSWRSSDYVKVYIAISGYPKINETGYGVFFGENDCKNVSQFEYHTGNVSAIKAAITAIRQAKKHGIDRLMIYSNLDYLLKFVDEWAVPWLANAWTKADGKPVQNVEYWRRLLTAVEGIDVKWSALSKTDYGYIGARTLAKNGLRDYVQATYAN
ncbi:hypothetical protein GHT06_009164 [Daphnia sinensis]|uniref:RNase H type-1 domain-containing protein n=1 Tax=Daphnia sinensis TaxID=1820382 RepID=A0AAD5L5J4_9CRUS|nr:hypothetical protein GHT06_009164 [Daphnia sinensis]